MEHIYFGLLCFITVILYGLFTLNRIHNKKTVLEEIVSLEDEARKEKAKKRRYTKIKVGFLQGLVTKTRQAGLKIGEAEILLAAFISVSASFFILSTLFTTAHVGIIGIPLGLYLPYSILQGKIRKRGDLLAKQLHGCLIMWSNSIRSGVSLAQAIEGSIDRVPPELNEELKNIKYDIDLGSSAPKALEKALDRIPVAEFKMVVMTARIHSQLGGNLAKRFENIATTIEDRVSTRANLKAYTTQARLGATVAGAMPFVVLGILRILSPDYLKPMIESPYGTPLMVLSVILIFLGWYTIKQISDFRVT